MFIKKVVLSIIAIGLITLSMHSNANDLSQRTIMFNGVLASQQELPVLDMLLGITAPNGHYVLNTSNGALIYSDGVAAPVLLGFLPVNRSTSSGTFEDEVGDFCAHNGGCDF